mmetsp:Transcript_30212/g.78006  ORF Transcript_30212/g.78006 Transcript_30212/m.78006 type:complete len:237 (-) Transcript_30212:2114-2824(-)
MLPGRHTSLVQRPVRIHRHVHKVVHQLQDELASPKSLPLPLDSRLDRQGGKQPVISRRVAEHLQQADVRSIGGGTVRQMGQKNTIYSDLNLLRRVRKRRDGAQVGFARFEVRGAAAGDPETVSIGESGGGGRTNLRIQGGSHLPLQEPSQRRQSRPQPQKWMNPEAQLAHADSCRGLVSQQHEKEIQQPQVPVGHGNVQHRVLVPVPEQREAIDAAGVEEPLDCGQRPFLAAPVEE